MKPKNKLKKTAQRTKPGHLTNGLTVVEIDKKALLNNLKFFRRIVGSKTRLMPIIKSNAYGHGFDIVAKTVAKSGADWIGTVNAEEALRVRKLGINLPVLVLSYYADSEIKQAVKNNIDLVVYDLRQAEKINKLASKKANVHIKVDTGTSRLGVKPNDAVDFISALSKLPNVNIRGIFTHFADSEDPDSSFMNTQSKILVDLINGLKKRGIKITESHAACSAAAMRDRKSHFSMVRVGISLYGLWPSEEIKELTKKKYSGYNLKPALTWKTKIIQVKRIVKNGTVGYDRTYQVKRNIKLAIIPVGYNEGFSRLLSNPSPIKGLGQGEVLIKGKRAPILGRVCMNLTMIDISNIPSATAGDEVVILGRQGKQEITAEEIAKKSGTINYEVVTRINSSIPRVLV